MKNRDIADIYGDEHIDNNNDGIDDGDSEMAEAERMEQEEKEKRLNEMYKSE